MQTRKWIATKSNNQASSRSGICPEFAQKQMPGRMAIRLKSQIMHLPQNPALAAQ